MRRSAVVSRSRWRRRDGEDGTRDATAARCGGRGARGRECASRIAWVQAVAVASVAKRGSAAQGSVVSGDGKDGREKRRWSCQCRVAVESADRSGRAARRQNRHRGIVVETSPHHLTRRTEEPGRAGGRAGGRRRARQNRRREVEAVRHSSVASRDLMRSEEEARAGGRHGTGEEGRRKEEVRRRDGGEGGKASVRSETRRPRAVVTTCVLLKHRIEDARRAGRARGGWRVRNRCARAREWRECPEA